MHGVVFFYKPGGRVWFYGVYLYYVYARSKKTRVNFDWISWKKKNNNSENT